MSVILRTQVVLKSALFVHEALLWDGLRRGRNTSMRDAKEIKHVGDKKYEVFSTSYGGGGFLSGSTCFFGMLQAHAEMQPPLNFQSSNLLSLSLFRLSAPACALVRSLVDHSLYLSTGPPL